MLIVFNCSCHLKRWKDGMEVGKWWRFARRANAYIGWLGEEGGLLTAITVNMHLHGWILFFFVFFFRVQCMHYTATAEDLQRLYALLCT